jgi:hypothetical protein
MPLRFMSMLPNLSVREGSPNLRCGGASGLNLTTALNCESIRPFLGQVSGFTVAQQPVNFTRFLFNSILFYENAHPRTTIKVKNEIAKVRKFFKPK